MYPRLLFVASVNPIPEDFASTSFTQDHALTRSTACLRLSDYSTYPTIFRYFSQGKEKLKKIRKIIKTKKKKDKPGSAVMEAVSGLSFFAIFLRL